jgi:hypothetical protein
MAGGISEIAAMEKLQSTFCSRKLFFRFFSSMKEQTDKCF